MTIERYHVAIIGAGLAGLSVARQLLLSSRRQRILLLDGRHEVPPSRQKVGESTVQVSGYYLAKVLELEEHLLREHFMKYNLRFYWKTAGRANAALEDYSHSYIRTFSNIPGYQLDRNVLEAELLRRNRNDPQFAFRPGTTDLRVSLHETEPHRITFRSGDQTVAVEADWIVDASGRRGVLAKQLGLQRRSTIRHGASFLWVEGLVNIEKLTNLTSREARLKPDRRAIGHTPLWLATNHFCGEGFWFWVIPLRGKTSLGLVYDSAIISHERVSSPASLLEWVCREFPLFGRDLPHRRVLHYGGYRDFAYDCVQTISPHRWALCGEAGRFSDPLYSPGGDLISLYNTLVVDTILTHDSAQVWSKASIYEQLMQAFYQAYVPSFCISYDALGDQEAMVLKYGWELAVYFSFYVFPFINDLFTDLRFAAGFLRRFTSLGRMNQNLQTFISAYYQWKKRTREPAQRPEFFDLMELAPLRAAENAFYAVGLNVDEARELLDVQLTNLEEFARFIVAHVASVVVNDERLLTNPAFVKSIDLRRLRFDPDEMQARYAAVKTADGYTWSFDPGVLRRFRTESRPTLGDDESVSGGGRLPCPTMRHS
jgi:2-polyprenyl-6-methoxyphenol hydroxylase-like FAD-dependent oxidoreductase